MTDFTFFWQRLKCSLLGAPRGWEKTVWLDYLKRWHAEAQIADEEFKKTSEKEKFNSISEKEQSSFPQYFADEKTARQITKEENARAIKETIDRVVTPIRSSYNHATKTVFSICEKAKEGICVAYQLPLGSSLLFKNTKN